MAQENTDNIAGPATAFSPAQQAVLDSMFNQTTATYRKTTDIGVFWPDAGGDEDVVDKDSLANF
ncbi:hypothetical protein GX50_07048 [[Emmonsia] crescens]|uniref:Uncharacterized protein n=1 Tax=[Emmonsia] crescens TaxID=73230 RepID=A0A2B7ZAG0_9EURO|nr:hypothetical protein GX50_07048 [Emmonsia crescens]